MAVIAHYKLNDNAATATVLDNTGVYNGTYKDAGGNVNTSTGANTGVGSVGTALDFDGTDEYVEIADNVIFTPILTPFSISVWMNIHEATGFPIASKGIYATDSEWRFSLRSDDKIYFACYDESASSAYIGRYYNTALTGYENQWIHLVVVYNGGILNSDIKIYLNGVNVDDTDKEGGTFVEVENLTHAVWIGRYDDIYADGLIDNVIIFNTELNEDEVKALYNGGHGTEIVEVIDLDRRVQRRQ